MRKLLLLPLLLLLTGCPKDKNARDTAAALKGLLATAQTQYQTSCQANKTQPACTTINKGISAQNALITAIETYCSMALTPTPPPDNTPCTPVKSAEGALSVALANAKQSITEVKGIIH
jgi:hypothetical protein